MTADQRRALKLLAHHQPGATETLMFAHGFKRETLAGLVPAELATLVTEGTRADAATINLKHYRITEDARATGAQRGHPVKAPARSVRDPQNIVQDLRQRRVALRPIPC